MIFGKNTSHFTYILYLYINLSSALSMYDISWSSSVSLKTIYCCMLHLIHISLPLIFVLFFLYPISLSFSRHSISDTQVSRFWSDDLPAGFRDACRTIRAGAQLLNEGSKVFGRCNPRPGSSSVFLVRARGDCDARWRH